MYMLSPYKENRTPVSVQAALPRVSTIYDTITLRGTLIEGRREDIYAQQASTIVSLLVKPGDTVKRGQLLMVLSPIDDRTRAGAAVYGDLNRMAGQIGQSVSDGSILDQDLAAVTASLMGGVQIPEGGGGGESIYIESPIGGVVMSVAGEVGDTTSGVLPCISVSDMKRLKMSVDISEDVLSHLHEGMACTITVGALGDGQFGGAIESIMPYARKVGTFGQTGETRTEVILSIKNPETLRPGYSAVAKAVSQLKEEALLIPYEAVLQDEQGREYVMLVGPDKRAVKRFVQTGYELEDTIEVEAGIDMNDMVIVNPQTIKAGKAVEVGDIS